MIQAYRTRSIFEESLKWGWVFSGDNVFQNDRGVCVIYLGDTRFREFRVVVFEDVSVSFV